MSYEYIDQRLYEWARKRGFSILKEDTNNERRFFHTSSLKAETFQVVIEPERNGAVRIDAHLIESTCDEEVHYIWEISVSDLVKTLDVCEDTIKTWFDR